MLVSPTKGKIVFDAVFRLEHSAEAVLTEHPVQSGAPISDHAYVQPKGLTMEVGMTDAIAGGRHGRSASAFQTFMELLELREPVRIVTRLQAYDNMVITSVSAPDDKTTMNALRAVITFKEAILAEVSVVSVQKKTSSTKSSSTKKKTTAKAGKSTQTVKKSATATKLSGSELEKKKKNLGR